MSRTNSGDETDADETDDEGLGAASAWRSRLKSVGRQRAEGLSNGAVRRSPTTIQCSNAGGSQRQRPPPLPQLVLRQSSADDSASHDRYRVHPEFRGSSDASTVGQSEAQSASQTSQSQAQSKREEGRPPAGSSGGRSGVAPQWKKLEHQWNDHTADQFDGGNGDDRGGENASKNVSSDISRNSSTNAEPSGTLGPSGSNVSGSNVSGRSSRINSNYTEIQL